MKLFEGRPFVMLGVNSDQDRDELRRVMREQELPWCTFWDGGSTHGPIATAWNVRGWPTLDRIDAAGVICFENLRGAALEELVAEAEGLHD